MSEKIEPALTAKQWSLRAANAKSSSPGIEWAGVREDASLDGPTLCLDAIHAADRETVEVPQGLRHAVAALALYNQPFGFTRGDVSGLRERATNSRDSERQAQDNMNVRIMNDARRGAELFESLADRIEALLPPEIKRGRCPERLPGEVEHLFVFGKATCECGERRSPHMR